MLTQQVFIGESLLGHGDGDGREVAREDVGLSHDEGGGRGVEGGERRRIALFLALVQLKDGHLSPTVLLVPIAVL